MLNIEQVEQNIKSTFSKYNLTDSQLKYILEIYKNDLQFIISINKDFGKNKDSITSFNTNFVSFIEQSYNISKLSKNAG